MHWLFGVIFELKEIPGSECAGAVTVDGKHSHAKDLADVLRRLQILKQRLELLRRLEERKEGCFSNLLLQIV